MIILRITGLFIIFFFSIVTSEARINFSEALDSIVHSNIVKKVIEDNDLDEMRIFISDSVRCISNGYEYDIFVSYYNMKEEFLEYSTDELQDTLYERGKAYCEKTKTICNPILYSFDNSDNPNIRIDFFFVDSNAISVLVSFYSNEFSDFVISNKFIRLSFLQLDFLFIFNKNGRIERQDFYTIFQ